MPKIQLVLGSKSDEGVVKESGMVDILEQLGANYEVSVCSAHRNPDELAAFCKTALDDDTEVFIAVAGMAAALPGAIAGNTGMSKPVIGVPLDEDGIDSCLYMPPGVPVLTAGVGKAGLKNAAIAAGQIAALHDQGVRDRLRAYLDYNAKRPEFNIDSSKLLKDA